MIFVKNSVARKRLYYIYGFLFIVVFVFGRLSSSMKPLYLFSWFSLLAVVNYVLVYSRVVLKNV